MDILKSNLFVKISRSTLQLLFISLSFSVSAQTIIYVNKNTSGGLQNGTSWNNAYKELSQALDALNATEQTSIIQVWVAAGVYSATQESWSEDIREKYLDIKHNIEIYGGFAGMETSIIQRNFETNKTILSGDIGTIGVNTDNSYHVVVMRDSTSLIDGFTITKGCANLYNSSFGFGGGIYIYNMGAKVYNCKLVDNYSVYSGGAVHIEADAIDKKKCYFENCLFENNSAGWSGAAILGNDAAVVRKSKFINNIAGINHLSAGGAISLPLRVEDCYFEGNISNGEGGAISMFDDAIVENSVFINNKSRREGGAMESSGTIVNCVFIGNFSEDKGGAVYNRWDGIVSNSTFYNNHAKVRGGGLDNMDVRGDKKITNCIIWGNTTDGEHPNFYTMEGGGIVAYNLVEGKAADELNKFNGFANIDATGWTTEQIFVNAAAGDLRLKAGSPAIDNGSNRTIEMHVAGRLENLPIIGRQNDVAGNPRFVNLIDIGAYEHAEDEAVASELYVDVHGNITGNGSSWAKAMSSLAKAIEVANANPNTVKKIHVAQGVYSPQFVATDWPAINAQYMSFLVKRPDLIILGGYPTGGGERNPATNKTTLTGISWTGKDGNGDPLHRRSTHVVAITKDNVTFDGFIIRDGLAIYNYSAFIETDGYPMEYMAGAGIYIAGNNCNILNCEITDNDAFMELVGNGFGAGITNSGKYTTIKNCKIANNVSGREAGGLMNKGENLTIKKTIFEGNKSLYSSGGGMYNEVDNCLVTDCVFKNNIAGETPNFDRNGGAIYQKNTKSKIINSTFTGNRAYLGGAVCTYGDIIGSLFYNNEAIEECGAIWNYEGKVVNSTIVCNHAKNKGGLYSSNVINSIVWGNTADETDPNMSFDWVTNSLVEGYNPFDLHCRTSILDGTNLTADKIFVDFENKDFRLRSDCFIVGRGDNTEYVGNIATDKDLTGNPRLVGGSVDVGAYEVQNYKAVASLTLNETELSVNLANGSPNIQLLATLNPSDATNKSLIWRADVYDEGILTVDQNGLVTPLQAGYHIPVTVYAADGFAASCLFILYQSLGINDTPLSLVSIYPSTFSDQLTIGNASNMNIQIYTSDGKLIFEKGIAEQTENINTSSWYKGVYIVRIGSDRNKFVTVKVVK